MVSPPSDIGILKASLKYAPEVLHNFIVGISVNQQRVRRIPGKWNIHEQVAHLVDVEPMLIGRFRQFIEEERPVFKPFFPDSTIPNERAQRIAIEDLLAAFRHRREALCAQVSAICDSDWHKAAVHPQYNHYTPYILLRHTVMHDMFHMYRIEELWLTQNTYMNSGG